jgi:hypothetical protein
MIIYNVTIKVDWPVHDRWLRWMKEETIPDIMATKLFYHYQFVRLLQVDEQDGPTYAVQYYAHSMEDYNRYIKEEAPVQHQLAAAAWGMQYIAFGTVMKAVE